MNTTMLTDFRKTARTVKLLKKLAWSGDVTKADIRLTGSIRLNSGIDRLAEKLGLTVETEPFTFTNDTGKTMECVFKVIRMGDVEILQAEDTTEPEE